MQTPPPFGVGMTRNIKPGESESVLSQDEPGQLGKIARLMAQAGVNIEAIYSDHDHQLILVVDDMARGQAVSEAWTREHTSNECSIRRLPSFTYKEQT